MKLTLLDMTQNILSALGSDEVNSFGDTIESRQVAEIVKTTYFNIIARANLPEHNKLFQLTASNDPDMPTLMYRPETVNRIEWIKYNTATDGDVINEPEYSYVTMLPIQQFLDMNHQLDPDETNVESFILNDFTFYFQNDRMPVYCTMINDYYIIFDGYDNTIDGTLQESKTLCYGRTVPTFDMTDNFIPDLDENQFPLLLNEAKSLAFMELKQTQHQHAEREARRQWNHLQIGKHAVKPNHFNDLPNFGRISRGPRWITKK